MATTVTSKGQVTIPKPVRDHLGIAPGSQVEFRRAADGSIVIEKADARDSRAGLPTWSVSPVPAFHGRDHGDHARGIDR